MTTVDEVNMFNELVCDFDRLADENGVEKIKTIGQTYMAAAGVPRRTKRHAAHCADFALALKAEVSVRRTV